MPIICFQNRKQAERPKLICSKDFTTSDNKIKEPGSTDDQCSFHYILSVTVQLSAVKGH